MHSRGDEMRRKYLYRVGLAILPVWMGRYIEIVGEKSSESIADTLINGIFGRVTGDAGSRFVIAIGQAIFLVLFLILYGDCIAARQRIGAVYFFSRISNRKKWILKEFVWLLFYSVLYTFCFVGMHMIFSIWGSSEANLSETLFKVAFQIGLFLTLLLFEMAVLCNLFCAAGGSAIGILLSMLCVIGLIMWSTAEVDGVVSEMIYPMWLSADIIENGGSYIQKIIIVFLQMAICAVGTGYYLAKRDLFAREGEG